VPVRRRPRGDTPTSPKHSAGGDDYTEPQQQQQHHQYPETSSSLGFAGAAAAAAAAAESTDHHNNGHGNGVGFAKMSPKSSGASKSHPLLPQDLSYEEEAELSGLPKSLVQQLREEEADPSAMSKAAKRGTKKLPPTPPGGVSREQRRRTIGATAGKVKSRPALEGTFKQPLPPGPQHT